MPYLNHPIGDTITVAEADEYSLFQNQFGFEHAIIIKGGYTTAKLMIVYSFDGIEHFEDEYVLDNELLDILPRVLAYQDSIRYGTSTSKGIPTAVEPVDGDIINGFITAWTGDYLLITSQYGQNRVPVSDIIHVDIADAALASSGYVWFRDPNNRLFFGPTGRSRKFGHGYYTHHYVIMPAAEINLPFRTSIGGSLIPFGGSIFSLGWVSGQITLFETESFALAVGNRILLTDARWRDMETTSATYVVTSFGDSNAQLVVGGGIIDEHDEPDNGNFLMIGGMHRVHRSVALISENYFLPNGRDPLASFGVRLIGTLYVLDFALIRAIGPQVDYVAFPWVSIGANF